MSLGGANALCFGADYFDISSHPDQSRKPFYFEEHQNAGCYPSILARLSENISSEQIAAISHKNAIDFITRLWS